MTTLTWLHISDLHCGMNDKGLWPTFKHSLLDDIERVGKKLGPIDLILFTGDLAFSGKETEYQQVEDALDAIVRALGPQNPAPTVLAVPGNHDMARPDKDDPFAGGLLGGGQYLEALWAEKAATVNLVRQWFSAYNRWWETTKYRPRGGLRAGLLPGDFSYVLEKEGRRFGFIGLNAAFLDVSDATKNVAADVRQVQGACDGDLPAWIKGHDAAFLLTHHPPSWFRDDSFAHLRSDLAPAGRFLAHLCGHLHNARDEQQRFGAGESRRIWQGSSLFGLEKLRDEKTERRHGYSVGRLVFEADKGSFQLWPRQGVLRQDGKWHLTVDTTYALESDLVATAAEAIDSRRRDDAPSAVPMSRAPAVKPTTPKPWADAAAETSLWSKVRGATPERITTLRESARKVVEACAASVADAQTVLLDDPWYDEDFPRRVLARLAAMAPSDGLGAEETFLLVSSPFLREGIYSAGKMWMSKADPFDLASRGTAAEPRNTLEQIHRARPDLVRHAERLGNAERRAVCLWMMARALHRSPDLWQPHSAIEELAPITTAIESMVATLSIPGITPELIVNLVRCVSGNPDILEGEGGLAKIGTLGSGSARVRPIPLGYMLSVTGWTAFDIRAVDEVAVDHLGRDKAFVPTDVCNALQHATWTVDERRYILVHECSHPVVDFVLRTLVSHADNAIERIRNRRDRQREVFVDILGNIPIRLVPDGIAATTAADGRPSYRLPHVRFQLDHTQVRELLTGEQLYGDATVAIREMYQNALDACRYRRARQQYRKRTGYVPEYVGRIVFQQGVDPEGRPFIECEDNGVGMTAHIIERVFSIAGRRFHDESEFVEERAAWRLADQAIDFMPNSQFGIGVLSYFMLADEVRVETRRYDRNGIVDKKNALVVSISSASGLFRLENGGYDCMPHGGTKVRLYLAKSTYKPRERWGLRDERDISCRDTIAKWLWIAEFNTVVEESGKPALDYPAGELVPDGQKISDCVPTDDPDVWWRNPEINTGNSDSDPRKKRKNPILVDGLRVDDTHDLILVNLRGQRRPQLSVDRRKIQSWDHSWLKGVMEKSWRQLLDWPRLTLDFLWRIEEVSVNCARNVYGELEKRDVGLPLDEPDTYSRLRLREVGCSRYDEELLYRESFYYIDAFREREPVHLLRATRVAMLRKHGRCLKFELPAEPRSGIVPRLEPGDWTIVQRALSGERVEAIDILRIHFSYGMSIRQVIERAKVFEACGLELAVRDDALERFGDDLERFATLEFDEGDWALLFPDDLISDKQGSRISIGRLLSTAKKFGWSFQEATRRLRRLSLACTAAFDLDAMGKNLTGELLDASSPLVQVLSSYAYEWYIGRLESEISSYDVLVFVRETELQPAEVLRCLKRLAPVGVAIAESLEQSVAHLILDKGDFEILAQGVPVAKALQFPAAPILRLARDKSWEPQDIIRRLEGYAPLGVEVVPNAEALKNVKFDDTDWNLLSAEVLSTTRWHPATIPLLHLAKTCAKLSMQPSDVVKRIARLAPLGYRFGFDEQKFAALELSNLGFLPDERFPWMWQSPVRGFFEKVEPTEFQQYAQLLCSAGFLSDALAERFAQLGDPPGKEDFIILRILANDAWFHQDEYPERARKRVPFYCWWLSEEDCTQRIERLAPIVDAALAEER